MIRFTVTRHFLDHLHRCNILLRYNCAAPDGAGYGWLKNQTALVLHDEAMTLEENAGLFGGPYKPLVGGRASSGLCSIGAFSYSYSALPDGLRLGRYCSVSAGLRFLDSAHPIDTLTTSAALFRPNNLLFAQCLTPEVRRFAASFSAAGSRPYPQIGHDVWIGHNVTLGMGLTIGHGAIIAANSTVVKDVQPYSIVGGNPARVIRSRFSEELVAALLESQWWNFPPQQVFSQPVTDPAALCRYLCEHELPAYQPRSVRPAQLASNEPLAPG